MLQKLSEKDKLRLKQSLKASFIIAIILNLIMTVALSLILGIVLLIAYYKTENFDVDIIKRFLEIMIPLWIIILLIPIGKLIDLVLNKKRVYNTSEFDLKIKKNNYLLILKDTQFRKKIDVGEELFKKISLKTHIIIERSYFSKELLSLVQNDKNILQISEDELQESIEKEAKENGW